MSSVAGTSHHHMMTTHTVGSGDDTIHYDVYGDLAAASSEKPALLTFANPMDAAGFEHSRRSSPTVRWSPSIRGARAATPTGTAPMTAELHAEDLHRVIEDLDVGPVDAFGSSGGAVCLLALLAAHPGDVRRAVVHEPPFVDVLSDGDVVSAACQDISDTYDARRPGPGDGEVHRADHRARRADRGAQSIDPNLDPAQFGFSAEDDGSRDDVLLGQNLRTGNAFEPDYAAVQAALPPAWCWPPASSRAKTLLPAPLCYRGLAERLGIETTLCSRAPAGFPSAASSASRATRTPSPPGCGEVLGLMLSEAVAVAGPWATTRSSANPGRRFTL